MAVTRFQSRVLAALIGVALLPPPAVRGQALLCPADTAIGSDPDDRTRLATLLGRAPGDAQLLRSLSSRLAPFDTTRGSLRRRATGGVRRITASPMANRARGDSDAVCSRRTSSSPVAVFMKSRACCIDRY